MKTFCQHSLRLFADIDVYSQSVPNVGLAGRPDHVIWRFAPEHDFALVTTNARDFIELLDTPVHRGLIVLRESGLSRQEQWERLRRVVEHMKNSGDEDFLLNQLIEITGVTPFNKRDWGILILLSPQRQSMGLPEINKLRAANTLDSSTPAAASKLSHELSITASAIGSCPPHMYPLNFGLPARQRAGRLS